MSKILDRAREAVRKKNYDYAVELFLQHLGAYPNDVDVRRELRGCEVRRWKDSGGTSAPASSAAVAKGWGSLIKVGFSRLRKNHDAVIMECENALKDQPRNTSRLYNLGNAARQAGHLETAIYTLEDILTIDKNHKDALRALAQIHREQGDLDKSSEYYERLLKQVPNDKEVQDAIRDNAAQAGSRRIQERTKGGDFRGMIKDGDKQAALEKQSQRVRTKEQAHEMIELINEQIAENPEDIKLYRQRAEMQVKAKDTEAAKATYEEALAIKDMPELRNALGDLTITDFDNRLADLQKQAKSDPKSKEKYKALQAEKLEFCAEEYRRRVTAQPTELGLRYMLGKTLFQCGRFDDAISELQKATQDPRRRVQSRKYLGHCFYRREMYDLAKKELERARKEIGDDTDENAKECSYLLGVIGEKQGDRDEAKRHFERILEHDYNYRDVVKRLERLS